MLRGWFAKGFILLLLLVFISGEAWEFEQEVVLEGVLKRAERTIIKNPNGKKESRVEKSVVLITDKPLVFSQSVRTGEQQLASKETSHNHIEVYLPEEFKDLIGNHVKCYGHFRQSFNPHGEKIVLEIQTVLDSNQSTAKRVFYEPDEVELSGFLYKSVYPGPPDYSSVESGDRKEEAIILTLKNPINVDITDKDVFNEPEKGVREIQVSFLDDMPSIISEEVSLKGTLYHAHTAHHHRRVLMMVNSWKVNSEHGASGK
jgi:hypothetical protein